MSKLLFCLILTIGCGIANAQGLYTLQMYRTVYHLRMYETILTTLAANTLKLAKKTKTMAMTQLYSPSKSLIFNKLSYKRSD